MTGLDLITGSLVDPCTDPAWADLASRGSLFHSPAWLRVLRDGYRLKPRAVVTGDGGFAWVEVDDVRGVRLVSLPFTDFAGPIGSIGPELVADAVAGSPGRAAPGRLPAVTAGAGAAPDAVPFTVPLTVPFTVRFLVAGGFDIGAEPEHLRCGLGLDEVGRLAWHWADLEPGGHSGPGHSHSGGGDSGQDRLWSALASGARQNIRRSRRSGVTVEVRHDLNAVAHYHRLHLGLRKAKYRLLAQPWEFFAALHQHFGPDRLRVVLARLDERPELGPVAGVILLRHGDWGYYKLNASTEAGWSVRANDAVMWEAMVQARRWGCRWFDFGVSDLDQPGLIRYKNKYATGKGEVVVMRRDGEGEAKPWSARLVDQSLPMLTRLLTAPRCPDVVGAQASRVLYRLFC